MTTRNNHGKKGGVYLVLLADRRNGLEIGDVVARVGNSLRKNTLHLVGANFGEGGLQLLGLHNVNKFKLQPQRG